jgi:hypothetical protein
MPNLTLTVTASLAATGGALELATGALTIADQLDTAQRAQLVLSVTETPMAIPTDSLGDPDILVLRHVSGTSPVAVGWIAEAAFVSSGQTLYPGHALVLDLTGFVDAPVLQFATGDGAVVAYLFTRKAS